MRQVILKPGKEKPIKHHHHWVFSGAIASMPKDLDGECLPVHSSDKTFLGWGYFNSKAKITGRMLAFDNTPLDEVVTNALQNAWELRSLLFKDKNTDAYRLVNGEGDLLPGLIIDRYADTFVIQIATLGMAHICPIVVEWLIQTFNPKTIYEKSTSPSRKEEGLEEVQRLLYGEMPSQDVIVQENGLKFAVSVLQGQKTGFFLDHREMRHYVKTLSKDKRVLNCFSYTGGFSIYAAAGGAYQVDSVDISENAVKTAERNMSLNGLASKNHHYYAADVFMFLREKPLDYDLVILDPPAFAKRQKDIIPACRGYKDINRIAMQKMPRGSILITSSCSYHVDEELFQKVVFQAAVEANRTVRILGRHQMAADHPINICHRESDYLKSLVLYVA